MEDIAYKYRMIILFAVAFIATMCVFFPILKIAKEKNIVDNPEARKLQKTPIPVMGGIAVFFGVVVGLCFYKTMISYTSLFPVLGAMIIMLYLGFIDDILTIKPLIRVVIESLVALMLIYGLKAKICNFQGLFGIDILPFGWSILLSVVTFIGIVNAVNLIDGVDGLSSGLCILALGFLGVVCFLAHQFSFAVLAAVCIGALVPFFFFNVFGKKTKMFIGDGGTLMIGTTIFSMVLVILGSGFNFPEGLQLDFSRIAFVVAALSVPIADTLRVMAVRICQGRSPFWADNNHMHHILISLGCTHLQTTMVELLFDLMAIGALFVSWGLGASVGVQLLSVIVTAAVLNWVMAPVLRRFAAAKKK